MAPDRSRTSGEADETTGGCSCEGTPIDLHDEVDEGYTPAEVLANTGFAIDGLEWIAIADDPQAAASGSTAYRGGPVFDEVGGCCGSFICAECPAGVTIGNVALTLSTADGRLDDVFLGSLTGYSLGGFEMRIDDVPIAALSGTLGNDTFDLDGTPFTPTTVSLHVRWNDDYSLEMLWVFGSDGLDGGPIGVYDPV